METEMLTPKHPKRRGRTADAASYIGLSKSTLEKYRVTGGGPVYASLGRIVIYDFDDLDIWVEARKRTSTSDEEGVRHVR